MILDKVSKDIVRKSYVMTLPSLDQLASGSTREITLKLVQRRHGRRRQGTRKTVQQRFRARLVVAEMNPRRLPGFAVPSSAD